MFKKLLSNLPFNPSLITEVSFYAKRLKKESSIRRLGFVFIALTMVVQIFSIISPAEASNQCSSNDIIRCGFKSQSEAVQRCNSNTSGFRTIVEYYGVTCATLASAKTQTIKSNAQNNQLFSMGRNPYKKAGEYTTNIPGAGNVYLRPLSSWGNTSYKMLVTTTPDGKPFMVMYDCGNIVILNNYTPPSKPEPAPELKINKINEPTGVVKPGDTIKYTIAFANTGGTAAFFSVNDTLDENLEFVSANSGDWPQERNGQTTKWYNNTPPFYTFGNTDIFGVPGFIILNAKVKNNVKDGTLVCNAAWLGRYEQNNGNQITTNKVSACNEVEVPCPEGTTKQPDGSCKKPEITCPEGTTKQPDGSCKKPEITCPEGTTKQPDGSCKKPEITCPEGTTKQPDGSCKKPTKLEPIITIEKKVKNITQKIENANNTTANAGDILEYTLITKNYGTGESVNTILKPEPIADILEYSTLDFSSLDGGVFDQETQSVSWNKTYSIKPNQAITKTFRVKISNPIPNTPSPTGNPGSFDLKLTNVYGNTVVVKLPSGVVKSTEKITTQTLPNTGPGEALTLSFVITVIVGYYFARSKLMAKELELVKKEFTSGA